MNINEFELRYLSYKGLSFRLHLDRDEDTLLNLTKITDKGILEKSVPETSPDDLKNFTIATYTSFKKEYINQNQKTYPLKDSDFSLAQYIERLEYELKVIKEMGFNSYFLIVSDYIRRAKQQTIIVGPGRGSWAGSLLARAVEITDIDPLPFGLLFERFLNPARISMPDFDVDFEDTQRTRVIEYCTEKYGQDKVCAIGTFMKMATKAAFKDAARAVGVPFDKANLISNIIPERVSIKELIANPEEYEEIHSFYTSDGTVQKAFDLAAGLEGNLRQLGIHACGIIIAPEAVSTYTAVQYAKENDHTAVSQYDGPTLEDIGLLKMDFLGLRNLSIIKTCIKIIKTRAEKKGEALPELFQHFFKTTSFQPDIHDAFTYDKIFKTGDTTGIFQFESAGMRKFLIQLEPNSINDLVAMNALYRPGPMEFIPRYIERKHGREEVSYMSDELRNILERKYNKECAEEENKKLIEDLSPIMDITYGIAVYQEQLMFLVQAMAGFSLGEADMLRRWVGKKKKEVIEQIKKEFIIKGADFRNYKPETCTYIYEKMIEPAASYSFNKSHSVCYSMIAYQTAYLKAHFPLEFSAALIRSVEEDTDTQSFYISEIQNHGILVLPPNINESFNHVAAIDDYIRLGFFSGKGIGEDIGEQIQQERKQSWPFSSLEDFLKRCEKVINKKSLESLIKSGALDQFEDRKILLENIHLLLDWTKNIANADFGLFGGIGVDTTIQIKRWTMSNLMERLMMEQEVLKSFVSGNPLDGLYPYIKKFSFLNQIKENEEVSKFIITAYIKEIQRAKKRGFFVKIEDISGSREFFIKDSLDLKKFDLIIIHGAKVRGRVYINKIIKTDYQRLIQLAWGKYDPERTVVRAKKERYGEEQSKQIEKVKAESFQTPPTKEKTNPSDQDKGHEDIPLEEERFESNEEINPSQEDQETHSFQEDEKINEENNKNEVENSPEENTEEDNKREIKLPENITKLQEIIFLMQQHPGDIPVSIMGKEKFLSQEGLDKIQALLNQE